MNFSKLFDIPRGHEHLAFVDVDFDRDTRLFIDPTLIEYDPSPIGRECHALITSYFREVFDCIRREDWEMLWQLSMFAREPNETALGLSRNVPSGRGASPEILMRIYQDIKEQGLLDNGLIHNPADIVLYTENFGADRMSDLLTNVIRRGLHRFTIEQCFMHSYALSQESVFLGAFWSPEAGCWGNASAPTLVVHGKKRLLVPKQFVSKRSVKDTSEMFMRIIIPYLQEEHLAADTSLVRHGVDRKGRSWTKPPIKADVRKDELRYGSTKNRVCAYLNRDFRAAEEYDEFTCHKLENDGGLLSDWELDRITYGVGWQLAEDA